MACSFLLSVFLHSEKEPNSSTVYARSRNGPVAKVQRGVRTTIRDLHLYSHHWELLARISYKCVHCVDAVDHSHFLCMP